jgi:uncharacterized protein (TIGR00645 family)
MRFSPSPSPTVVVVLPSPAGVGLIAVTKDQLAVRPVLLLCDELSADLCLVVAIGCEMRGRNAERLTDLEDRFLFCRARDLDVGFAFGFKFMKVAGNVFLLDEGEMILAMLGLIDAALVASLIVMVMISGYENFVSRFDESEDDVSFIGKLDAGSLKIKVASSIVAISSIHLLQVFLNVNQYRDGQIMWLTAMHLAFVVSAVMLGFLEHMMKKAKGGDKI